MSPRRVLLMISSMRGGGSERQTLLLLQHLDRNRFQPHLYLTERTGDLLTQVPSDVRVHSFDEQPRRGGIYFPGRVLHQQTSHLRQLLAAEAIDLVYDRTFQMTLLAGPAARAAGVPRVSTIVSPPDLMLPPLARRFVRIKRRRLSRAYRRSAAVIAVSQQAAESARLYYWLPNDAVRVLRNPVDRMAVQAASRLEAPRRDNRLTLVCVGRMTEEKGHADFLEALRITEAAWPQEVDPLRVWLIGDGPLRESLERDWNADPHRHQVEFRGASANPAPAIAAADALLLPSRFEGMPNVVLEAMSLGTPVIATRSGGTVELEEDRPTILWADPGRPTSLANAILEFVSNQGEAASRVQAASDLVRTRHDVGETIATIQRLFDEAIG